MKKNLFPIPENEQQRLAALKRYAVLDTPPEEVFDRITRMAAALLDVPITLISLVDESRQWFKSKVGLDATQTGRDIAFCAHTIVEEQLMIVPDTSKDNRFCRSPLVVGDPNIAFYAGAQIKTADGHNLGTLCAIDTVPRSLTDKQRIVLQDLANMVMDALELRLTNAQVAGKIELQKEEFKTLNQDLQLIGEVFNNLDYSILFFDKLGKIKSMNVVTANMFGYSIPETIGQHISLFFPPPYDQLFNNVFNPEAAESGSKINTIPMQISGLRKDGSLFPLELSLAELKIEHGSAFRAQFQDTTNRDLADKMLEQFKFPLDITQNFIFMFREGSLHFDYVSQGAIKLTGYSQEELHGMTLSNIDRNLDIEHLRNKLIPLLDGTQSDLTYETTLRSKIGTMIPVQIALKIDGNESIGKRIVAVGTDITDRKKTNQAILDNQARLHAIVDTAVDGIITISEGGLIETSNRAAEELFGYSKSELKGKNVKILMPTSYAREHDGYLDNYKRSGEAKIIGIGREVTGKRKDGSEFPMELSVAEVQLGGARLYTGIVRDITERQKDNQSILDNQARLHAIVDTAVDGIITISEKGLIETSNSAAEELFGYSKIELKGKNVKILMPTSYASEHDGYLDNYKRSREAKIIGIGREVTGKRKDGSEFPMELSVAEVQLGGARLYTGIVRDITERKKAEADLRQAMDDADNANRAKSDFLSRMSHELRTPLNAIVGFGEIMKMEPLSNIQLEYIEHILKAGTHLSSLINEVLEIARIEAGQQNLSIEAVGVKELVIESWGLMRPMAAERNIEFSYSSEDDNLYVMADLQRLKQVLLNLLSNAVKYNCLNGGINVFCGKGAHDGILRISVQDTGHGIEPENFKRIFEVFERLNADQGQEEGSGVGLALSKALMRAMSGELGLESVVGKGSVFWLELPIGSPVNRQLLTQSDDIPAFTQAANNDSKIFHILYIEDNLSNLRLVEALLSRRHDLTLTPAMKGNLGIELALKHRPHLILLDMHLPDIQGDEVLLRLRSNPATAAIPILILSADATNSQIDKLLGMGANAYITKPLDIRKFIATVDEILQDLP